MLSMITMLFGPAKGWALATASFDYCCDLLQEIWHNRERWQFKNNGRKKMTK